MAKIDIDFIKKWVSISEEELMQRLVKDAVTLQKEAEDNYKAALVAARKSDNEYDIDFVKQFFMSYKYFSQYFTDEEILTACKNNMGKRDLTREEIIKGYHETYSYGRVLRHDIGNVTEYRGSWERKVCTERTILLIPNPYQSILGAADVCRELIVSKCPYIEDYDVSIYTIDDRNDWIYVKTSKKGYATNSLYVPVSALFTKDAQKIIGTHSSYWHNYGSGKYDNDCKEFLASDFVKDFLAKVVA